MVVTFSFHLSHCLVFGGGRKSACVDNQPALWLSIVGDKPPQSAAAETVLLVFASSLFFSLGWAPLCCSCPLAGVTRVVKGGWASLCRSPAFPSACDGSKWPRQQGRRPPTWPLRTPKGIKQ